METQIALVIGAVAVVRQYVPQIDGWRVLAAALAVAAVIVFAGGATPDLEAVRRIVLVWLGAVGITRTAQQLKDRVS